MILDSGMTGPLVRASKCNGFNWVVDSQRVQGCGNGS
jgi:hypothetical protein